MGVEFEGSAEKCKVVGIKPNGERIVISSHDSQQMAQHTIQMISHGSEFASIEIEVVDEVRT